ncbi:MAG: mechanosensitive ion channel family protein [Bacteriovoracia bacterium]
MMKWLGASADKAPLAWLIIFATSLLVTLILKLVLRIVSGRLRKLAGRAPTIWASVGLDLVDGLRGWVLHIGTFYVLSRPLPGEAIIHRALWTLTVFASSFQLALWGLHLIRNWRKAFLERRVESDPSSSAAIGLIYKAMQAAFLLLILMIAMSNLGIDISALIASLGVGGIAVALAAQNVLGDLLASLSIVFDKPFVVGDFIVAGDARGTVLQIGIKTTRLRSLSGEELVLSNKDLLESRIQNFKRMQERRVVQKFGILYSTPAEKIEQVSGWVRQIIEARPKLRFDRCHFAAYGDSSLDFEFVFYVLNPDYNAFMDLQQEVLLAMFRKFREEGVDFAFPTRTLFIEKSATPTAT